MPTEGLLEGRVALVSGGGRGIGRAVAVSLAEEGADIAVNYRRDADSAKETVDAVESLGRRVRSYQASVDDYEADREMVNNVVNELGPVGILVNNAGIAGRGHAVSDTDPAELQRVMNTHAMAAHHLCQLALPSMRECDRGDIVMISSAATRLLGPYGAPYNMAKAALEALALTLAKEERDRGIRVNVVAPGLVETEMGRRLVRGAMGVQDIHQLDASSPFGRVCQPLDVAEVVRFVVSSAYVNGQVIYVDGGA